MAARVSARLTRRGGEAASPRQAAQQGRRFGFTVGGAFLVFAAIAWWREAATLAPILAALGATLGIAALVAPAHLGPVERAWMALAHVISRVTTPIVMAVMYFVVITPSGIARRAFGGNPLVHADAAAGFWKPRPANGRRSKSMERQF
jgi:hypothetical protein